MKFMQRFGRVEKGFTLIEVMIVLIITGVIAGAVVLVISSIVSNNSRNIAHMMAVKQVENTLFWMTEDTVQAQIVNVNGTDYFVDLQWTDLSGNSHEVKYRMDMTNKTLTRCYDNGVVTTIATDVNITQTKSSFANGRLTINLTVNATGYPTASESREVNICPRTM